MFYFGNEVVTILPEKPLKAQSIVDIWAKHLDQLLTTAIASHAGLQDREDGKRHIFKKSPEQISDSIMSYSKMIL